MVAAQPASAEMRKVCGGLTLWRMKITEVVATVRAQAKALAFPKLVESAIGVLAPASIVTAELVPFEPGFARTPSSDPAVVATQPQLAELREMRVALGFDLAFATISTGDGVTDIEISSGQFGVVSQR